jgi:hypothetical protein
MLRTEFNARYLITNSVPDTKALIVETLLQAIAACFHFSHNNVFIFKSVLYTFPLRNFSIS